MNKFDKFKTNNKLSSHWSTPFSLHHLHNLQSNQLEYRQHWGNKIISTTIQGNTWNDVYIASDEAIKLSGDQHHIFIESFEYDPSKNVTVLITGS